MYAIRSYYAVLSLDYNGNGITYGNKIIKEMKKYGMDDKKRPLGSEALKKYIDAKHTAEGDKYKPLNFGMVHPVYTHNYELRYWMATSGIKPDEDTTIKPFPPPTMPSNLRITSYNVCYTKLLRYQMLQSFLRPLFHLYISP